jgi:serine/threonine protein kinase
MIDMIKPHKPLIQQFPRIPQRARDFLLQILTFKPMVQLTAQEACCHLYIIIYYYPMNNPILHLSFHIENEVGNILLSDETQ